MIKVSIIIPVYNVNRYIEKCINCICNQTMQEDVECIIINDCTPDNSIDIVKSLISHYNGPIAFKIIEHDTNRGLAAARKTGMSYANGDYVLHLDSDDYYEFTIVEDLYHEATKYNSDIVFCDFYRTYMDHEEYISATPFTHSENYVKELIRHNYDHTQWNVWNKLIKRSLFINNNINWCDGIDYGEDLLICIKLFCFARNISKINKALYHYTQYNNFSYSNTLNISILEKEPILLKEIEGFLNKNHLYTHFETDINYRKLVVKITLLRFGKERTKIEYNKLYPEANKYIGCNPLLSKGSKLKLYIANFNIYFFMALEILHKYLFTCKNIKRIFTLI